MSVDADGWATIDVKNKFRVGDTLEIIHPSGNQIVTLNEMRKEGIAVQEAAGGGHIVSIPNMQGKDKALLTVILP